MINTPQFDHFLAIDWSSRAKPSPAKPTKDAIWVGEGSASGRVTAKYFRTRQACIDYVEQRLAVLLAKGKRVLLGWDFSFGYPAGLGKALKIKKKRPWKHLWKLIDHLIVDHADNSNNRFSVGGELNRRISVGSGPFWGVPVGQSGIFLGSKKDFTYPVINKRATLAECRLVEARVPKMQPTWKLAYVGSVGSQALLGIPRLYRLCLGGKKLKKQHHAWPFQTAFADKLPDGPCAIHAEIYPSMVPINKKDKIVDRAQVRGYVQWLQTEQAEGRLHHWLAGPDDLSEAEREQVLREEGWVFGVE
jgi:hypothetical protein